MILVHVCCAPCATIPSVRIDGITFFFYNPNISDNSEYSLRLEEVRRFSKLTSIPLVEGKYNHKDWLSKVSGMESHPEGGKRCEICYRIRLEETAKAAKGFTEFATSLTLSPHKSEKIINQIGEEIEKETRVKYLSSNFKKANGYNESIELSKRYGFYRQDYCGCEFSKRSIQSPKL